MPTALVLGASRGLGLEFVRQYRADGWRVVAAARSAEGVEALKALGAEVHMTRSDVGKGHPEYYQDMAQALGLAKIDLWGGSYGPRIEAAVITHQPHIVRAAVMDSPWPPEGNWAVGTPEQVSAAVKIILAKCAAQTACAAQHPNLQARFETEARKWLAGPVTGKDGRTFTEVMGERAPGKLVGNEAGKADKAEAKKGKKKA